MFAWSKKDKLWIDLVINFSFIEGEGEGEVECFATAKILFLVD